MESPAPRSPPLDVGPVDSLVDALDPRPPDEPSFHVGANEDEVVSLHVSDVAQDAARVATDERPAARETAVSTRACDPDQSSPLVERAAADEDQRVVSMKAPSSFAFAQ